MEVFVVQTPQLVVFSRSDVTSRNLVDDEEQDDGNEERPGCAGRGSSELVAHLLPVLGPPAAGICVAHAVHGRHIWCGEEAGQNVSNESANAMDSEDIQTLIDVEEVLVFDSEEGAARGDGSNQCGRRDWHIPSSWCDTDETGDDAGAETDDRELADEGVFQ